MCNIESFFQSMRNVVGQDSNYDVDTLKQLLTEQNRQGVHSIAFLSRSWAILEMCIAAPNWEESHLRAICFSPAEKTLVLKLIANLLDRLADGKIPAIPDSLLSESIDFRILLLDSLHRHEIVLTLELGISLDEEIAFPVH